MCTSPIVINYKSRLNKNSDGDIRVYGMRHSQLVTCGKCDECLKQYQNDWMTRLYSEMKVQHKAVFFTLTYRPDAVPTVYDEETGEAYLTVRKEHVASFMKQVREMRRKKGLSVGFRWFLTSEYGPTTLRPHYHGLVLGLSEREFAPFAKKWSDQYGFVQKREFNMLDSKTALCSIRYVAKYCAKGSFENPLVAAGKVEPTFHLMSKSIGKNYLDDAKKHYYLALDFVGKRDACGKYTNAYLDEITKRLNFTIPPCTYHLARYYREMVFEKRKDLQMAYSDHVCERVLQLHAPTLAQISTDKPYRSGNEAVYQDLLQDIRDTEQRASDARKSIVKHLKKSKI